MPPTSATPVVPPAVPPSAPLPSEPPFAPIAPAPVRRSVPPVSRESVRRRGRGARGAGTAVAGAGKLVSERASQLGGWVQRQGLAKVGAAVAALAVLGLIIWWLASLGAGTKQPAAANSPAAAGTSSSAPASRGPLPLEGIGALDFQLGDCFKDFDPDAPTSTVVDCSAGHSAQLIAIQHYTDGDSYPGRDPLKQRALDACKAAPLTEKQADYVLSYKLAYPSATSWDKGDRRVDCYVTASTGNVILESLRP